MKCSRMFCFVLALLMLCLPCAYGVEGQIFSYVPLEGVTCVMQEDAATLTAPEGLEAMYAFFQKNDPNATVCIFRMPNGRALVSVGCTELATDTTTEDLYILRDLIADGLEKNMEGTLVVQEGFRREQFCNQEAMVLDATLKGDNMGISAQAVLFCRGRDLIEVWTVRPSSLSYVFNADAKAELDSDLACLELLLQDFDFGDGLYEKEPDAPAPESSLPTLTMEEAETSLPHMTITADDGTFRVNAPLDTIVIHAGTDADTVARARALFAERTGGGECFDLWYQDVVEQQCWLLVSREYGLGMHITVDQSITYPMTAAEMAQLEEPVMDTLQDMYDYAALGDETVAITLDGKEHVWFTYQVGKGGMELLTYVLTAADGTGIYEADIYLCQNTDKDPDELSEMMILLMNSLDYLPETQL